MQTRPFGVMNIFVKTLNFSLSYAQLKLHGCHITLLPPRGNRISSATLAFNQILLCLLLYFKLLVKLVSFMKFHRVEFNQNSIFKFVRLIIAIC